MPELDPYTKAALEAKELLKQGQEYEVSAYIPNTTILHPLPGQVYWRDMGTVALEQGDKVTFQGTAKELKTYGDTHPDNPIFKPGVDVTKRNQGQISPSDVVSINPFACKEALKPATP